MVEPLDKKKRRDPEDPFSFLFGGDIDREFERMRRMMDDMLRQFGSHPGFGTKPGDPGQPFVYGFSMRVGPDGKPQFQEFGNTARAIVPAVTGGQEPAREPLIDVIEHDETVSITAEIPGVQKEDVKLNVSPDRVTIRVDTAERKYFKEIELPCRVVSKTTDATFNNGVLDITIEREAQRKDEDTSVRVK